MKTLTPQQAPELLCGLLDETHGYAMNCSFPNSLRILNRSQYEILQAVNGHDDLQTLAGRLGIPCETLKSFLMLLAKIEIIRWDNDFSAVQKPARPRSLNFWIHTTNACNLGCSYCYISILNTGKGMTDAVRKQLIFKLAEAARLRGIRHIKLRLAGGEPLGQFGAWKTFTPEAVTALATEGCKIDIGFVTNLTMLNDEILEFSKNHPVSFGVSLDGVAGVHDATRKFRSGTGSFHVVDANLRKLLATGVPITVNTVVSNHNLTGLPDLTRYLISLDVLLRYSIVKGGPINAEGLEKYLSASYDIMQDAVEAGWSFSSRLRFCDLKLNELGFQTCASGFSGGAIYVDGTFKYCHVLFGKGRTPSSSIFSGEADLVEMIEQGEHYEDAKSEDCRKCRYRSVCTSGCPVYSVDGKDPHCSLYHRFIPMYYELGAKERLRLLRQCGMI